LLNVSIKAKNCYNLLTQKWAFIGEKMDDIAKKHMNKIQKQNKENTLLGYFLGGGSETTNKKAKEILKNLKGGSK